MSFKLSTILLAAALAVPALPAIATGASAAGGIANFTDSDPDHGTGFAARPAVRVDRGHAAPVAGGWRQGYGTERCWDEPIVRWDRWKHRNVVVGYERVCE